MRTPRLLPLLALLLAAAPAVAKTLDFPVYLHEIPGGGLHVVPETMNAAVGDTIELTVYNQGIDHDNSPHDLVLCGDDLKTNSAGLPVAPGRCSQKLGFTPLLDNNQTRTLTATLARGGQFAYYCDIPGHAEAGMLGVLHVSGGAATPPTKTPGVAVLGTLMSLAVLALLRRRP